MDDNDEIRVKYPRTPHLWYSPGATSDDRMLSEAETLSLYEGREIVVSEKIDGECSTVGRGYTHARSLDSQTHPSQAWIKAHAAQVGYELPEGWRLCGEGVYAEHTISYSALPSYFLLFSIWDERNRCLPWDETEEYAKMLGLSTVPVLYRGLWDLEAVQACWTGVSKCGGEQEGYVVRLAGGFAYEEFAKNLCKFVRKGHVPENAVHWRHRTVIPNGLAR